jgi:DMSO reductase anchor subunit
MKSWRNTKRVKKNKSPLCELLLLSCMATGVFFSILRNPSTYYDNNVVQWEKEYGIWYTALSIS